MTANASGSEACHQTFDPPRTGTTTSAVAGQYRMGLGEATGLVEGGEVVWPPRAREYNKCGHAAWIFCGERPGFKCF